MKLAYLFISYPGVSQSFLHREISGLAGQGFQIEIHALLEQGTPTPESLPPGTSLHGLNWVDWALFLPRSLYYLVKQPSLIGQGVKLLLTYPPKGAEGWRHTLLGTLFAVSRAATFQRSEIDHLHAAWATAPATAAAILSILVDRPFSFGAQAYDIYRHGGDSFLAPKMRAAKFIHTTTEHNVRYLSKKSPESMSKIKLVRRGLSQLPPLRTKNVVAPPLHLLSVARLIPKKGHAWQLEACALLQQRGLAFKLKLVGDGPLREELIRQVDRLKLRDSVEFCGHLPQSAVQDLYPWAHLLWHTGIIDAEGDRDGLPNVVPEAMAHGVTIIASQVGAVTEAIIHQQTGLVVDVTQPNQLAQATELLASDEDLRYQLGSAGRRWVETNFLSQLNSLKMANLFRDQSAP